MEIQANYKIKIIVLLLFCFTTITVIQIPNSRANNIKKKDGTVDQRKNDLDEFVRTGFITKPRY